MANQLKLLGGAVVEGEQGAAGGKVARRHPLALLALLVTAPSHTLTRDRIIGLLWPELSSRRARGRLRATLHLVRKELGAGVVRSVGDDLRLDPERLVSDVTAFEEALEAGDRETAVGLYRGPLLDGFHLGGSLEFERWLDEERRRLARRYEQALERLAAVAEKEGHPQAAAAWWRRLASARPVSGRVAARLMGALAAAGERAEALRWAERYARRLREEFGTEPNPEVVALAGRLRSEPPPAAVVPLEATAPPSRRNSQETQAPVRSGVELDPAATGPVRQGALLDLPRRGRAVRKAGWIASAVVAGGILVLVSLFPREGPAVGASPRAEDLPRILVLGLENRTGEPSLDPAGQFAGDWVARGLAETGLVGVIPPFAVLRDTEALRETEGDRRIERERAPPLELAADVGADLLLSGSFARQGDFLVYHARLLDATSGEIFRVVPEVRALAAAPVDAAEELRRRTMGVLAAALDPRFAAWTRAASQPPSLEAYRHFAQGLDRFLAGGRENYRAAAHLFEQAARPNSGFVAPLIWAARARRWGVDHAGADSLVARIAPLRDGMSPWDRAAFDYVAANLRGDHLGAYRAMQQVTEIAPGSEWIWQLAVAAYWINRPEETVELLLAIDPRRGWLADQPGLYWTALLRALHRMGKHAAELEQVHQWRERTRSPSAGVYQELRALAALGEGERLDARLPDVLRSAGSPLARASLLYQVGRELEVHGHGKAASPYYARALAASEPAVVDAPDPEDHRLRERRGRALLALGRLEEARAIYRALAAELPSAWAFHGRLGVIAARLGERKPALGRFEAIGRTGHRYGFGEHTSWQATVAAALGERDEAVRLFRQALEEGLAIHDGFHTRHGLESLRGYQPYEELMAGFHAKR